MCAHDLLVELSEAGFSVAAEGDRLVIQPASKLTDDLRDALRVMKHELLRVLTGRDARAGRLMRWGWPVAEAEALAGRIERRAADDDRRCCVECQHFGPWRCANRRNAVLDSADVGRDLASLPQRCPGFQLSTLHL